MTPFEREEFKKKIQDRLIIIKEDIDELEILTQPIKPDVSLGRISRMDAINNKSINEKALRNAREKFTKMEYALSNIDDPEFGKCSQCKSDIHPRRLLFMPESDKCVKCAR